MHTVDPLAGLNEAAFRTRILVPLLSSMGYRDVDHTHGPNELGKDIVAWEEARDGSREYTAFVAKVGNISARATGDAQTIATQVRQALRSDIRGKTNHQPHRARTVVVTTTGTIRQEAREAILLQFDELARGHVKFWDGDFIRARLAEHSARTFAGDIRAVQLATESLRDFDVRTVIEPGSVAHEILPRVDTWVAKVELSFPGTSEAEEIKAAFDRFLDDGEPVTIPAQYISSFEQHEELTRLFGDEMPAELSIGPVVGAREVLVAVEVDTPSAPLCYEGLLLRCVRSGRVRSSYETGADRPLRVKLQTERLDSGQVSLGASLALQLAGHTPTEAEHAVLFWAAVQAGAEFRLRLVQVNQVLFRGSLSSVDTDLSWLHAYVGDLVAIQRRLGWDLRMTEMVSDRDQLDAAELRSILDTGIFRSKFSSYNISLTLETGASNKFLEIAGKMRPFRFRTSTEMAAYEILDRTVDLGVAHTFGTVRLADGEADRVRALMIEGANQLDLKLEAAGDKMLVHVYRDFLPSSTRPLYDYLIDYAPPDFDWSPESIAKLVGDSG